jgi:hypothetical protein
MTHVGPPTAPPRSSRRGAPAGTCSIKILGQDLTYNMACLLIRMLPPAEYKQASLLMSTLRVFVRNPGLCVGLQAGECPRVSGEQTSSVFRMMFKGMDNIFSRTCKEVQPYLASKRDVIEWQDQHAARRLVLPLTANLPEGSATALPRALITTKVDDLSCAARFFKPLPLADVGGTQVAPGPANPCLTQGVGFGVSSSSLKAPFSLH